MTESDLFWLELRAYCAAAAGDTATADMTREIMNAQGAADPAYSALIADVMDGAKKPVEKIEASRMRCMFSCCAKQGCRFRRNSRSRRGHR